MYFCADVFLCMYTRFFVFITFSCLCICLYVSFDYMIWFNFMFLYVCVCIHVCKCVYVFVHINMHVCIFFCTCMYFTQMKSLADENLEISFIDELQHTIKMEPKKNTLIVLGDFNSKLGKTKKISVGTYGRGRQNSNGTFLNKLLSDNRLIATNTCFKHKAKHITTWEGTRKIDNKLTSIYNTIDYVTILIKHKWRLLSERSFNGLKTHSDHRLVKTPIMATKTYQRRTITSHNKKQHLKIQGKTHQLEYRFKTHQLDYRNETRQLLTHNEFPNHRNTLNSLNKIKFGKQKN